MRISRPFRRTHASFGAKSIKERIDALPVPKNGLEPFTDREQQDDDRAFPPFSDRRCSDDCNGHERVHVKTEPRQIAQAFIKECVAAKQDRDEKERRIDAVFSITDSAHQPSTRNRAEMIMNAFAFPFAP